MPFAVRRPRPGELLGRFDRAGFSGVPGEIGRHAGADFDGDGVADTLNGDRDSPATEARMIDRGCCVDRSPGVIKRVGSAPRWLARGETGTRSGSARLIGGRAGSTAAAGRLYNLSSFPLPAGDLNGDGTPDVIATGRVRRSAGPRKKQGDCRSRSSRAGRERPSGRRARCL